MDINSPASQIFNEPRNDKDVNLIIECGQCLIDNGLKSQVEQYYITDPDIQLGRDKNNIVQRQILDKFWRSQLLALNAAHNFTLDTLPARQNLIFGGTDDMWLSLFRTKLMPFILHHDLPRFKSY